MQNIAKNVFHSWQWGLIPTLFYFPPPFLSGHHLYWKFFNPTLYNNSHTNYHLVFSANWLQWPFFPSHKIGSNFAIHWPTLTNEVSKCSEMNCVSCECNFIIRIQLQLLTHSFYKIIKRVKHIFESVSAIGLLVGNQMNLVHTCRHP